MLGRLLGWYIHYIYIHFRGLLPPNGILPGANFTLCPSLAFSYSGSVTARQWASAKLCGVVQRMELENFHRRRHLCSAGRPSRWATATAHILHRVSKKVPPLACYIFDAHEWILIFFGRNVADRAGNRKTLYYATSRNLCFCTTWQNVETRKSHISLNWIVLHIQCTCALSSWKKKLSSVIFLIVSNICWDSKISY